MNKTPKGTVDLYNTSFDKIERYSNQLKTIFKSYGGVGLETPVFEIKENLMGKYGDEAENKLVFNLEDCKTEKGEKYTLRYDLTVPKLRFIRSKNIKKGRIYSIGKVYRRDNPSLGRYREFYQADFDIIGEDPDTLLNECLLLKMANDFLTENGVGDYTILVNDTRYLFEILVKKVGVTEDSFKSICSTIDKLDKCSFDSIITELNQKGMTGEQIDKLKNFLEDKSERSDITTLVQYSDAFGFGEKIRYEPSLARGLDYYNGLIYEIKLNSNSSSIISGGRYDQDGRTFVGISFGLSRIVDLIKQEKESEWKDVYYLAAIPEDNISLMDKLKMVQKCETLFKKNVMFSSDKKDKKLVKTISYCIENRYRYLIIVGSKEMSGNYIIIKDLSQNVQYDISL